MFEVVRKICRTGIATRKETRGEAPGRCRGKLEAREEKCGCCGNCAAACPTKAIGVLPGQTDGKPIISISYERCIFCGACAKVCANGALKISNNPCPIIIKAPEDGAEPSVQNKPAKKIFRKSLHIRHLDSGSCNGCDFEMNTLTNPVYDIQRFGVDFVASPRHADMLMVTGGVTRNLEQVVRDTFDAAAHPKIVVAVGTCACGGGIFGSNYAGCAGADKTVPVFMRIPGCPPRPQALIEGILAAMEHDF